MMTFGTNKCTIKAVLAFLFIMLFGGLQNSYAQSDEVLAKSYFLKAQEAYSNGDNSTALNRLDQTVEYLSTTNARIEALYVKIALNQEDYQTAEKHLKTYFETADESRSDYMEMIGYVADVKEKKAEAKENTTKIALLKQSFVERIKTKIESNSREEFARQIARNEVAISWRETIMRFRTLQFILDLENHIITVKVILKTRTMKQFFRTRPRGQ